ncbi:MAG: hypothetical protein DWQ19_09455 [Crenarchaeota archaeon]|nr:MAG: hypothetical protein DWQ19_09455 [Thermoproteota archaeon]
MSYWSVVKPAAEKLLEFTDDPSIAKVIGETAAHLLYEKKFTIGAKVVTIETTRMSSDWNPEFAAYRRFNVEGEVINVHDAHGLCFEVKHTDGTVACYDPWELKLRSKNV